MVGLVHLTITVASRVNSRTLTVDTFCLWPLNAQGHPKP